MRGIDLQINGAFGVDFNDPQLQLHELELACQRLNAIGVEAFLPTIITDSIDAMCHKIENLVSMKRTGFLGSQSIAGIHVEGPFLSDKEGYFGTHPKEHIRPATIDLCKQLIDAGMGEIRLVTLAPEQVPSSKIIDLLVSNRASVFAGHCDASIDQLQSAIDAGLSGFTHLGNGCARHVDRQDNVLNRVLSLRESLWITLIADGIHVPLWLLKSWLEWIGPERAIVISDAIAAAGMPPGVYKIGAQSIEVTESRRTVHQQHGYLAGSATHLDQMDEILKERLGMDESFRDQVLYRNPKRLLDPSFDS